MRKFTVLLLLGVALQFSASAQKTNFKQFTFMLGSWEMKTPKGKITESWVQDKNGFRGKSYSHNLKGDSTLTETIIIRNIEGNFYFCVTGLEKNNTGTTNFKMVSSANNTFIFENKLHDFPQRIIYQDKGKDNLLAWIEGTVNGKKMKSEFPYRRKK
jgi:hypothetical protein